MNYRQLFSFKLKVDRLCLLVFVMLVFSNYTFGQERITDLYQDGDNKRYVLKEVDNEQYLLSIDKFDSLRVYRFLGTELELLYSRKFEGLQFELEYYTTDHFLVFQNSLGGVAYNFKEDEIKVFPFPEGFEHNQWFYFATINDEIILRQSTKDFDFNEIRYVDLATDNEIMLDYGYPTRLSSHFIYQRSYSEDDFSDHIFINIESLERDTFPLFANDSRESIVDSIYHVYIDDKNVYRRNLITNELVLVYNIPFEFSYSKIEALDDVYAIQGVLGNFSNQIILINKSDLQLQASIVVEDVEDIYPAIVEDQLIFYDWTTIKVYNLNTHSVTDLISFSDNINYTKIVDEQYLVYPRKKLSDNEIIDVVGIYDLKNESIIESDVLIDSPYQKLEFVKISEDLAVLNFESIDDDKLNLFEFNVNALTIKPSEKYSNIINGFSGESTIFNVGNDIILYSDDLYFVNETEAEKLNTSPIYDVDYSPYKIVNDEITWVEEIADNQFRMVKFKNGAITTFDEINMAEISPFGQEYFSDYTINDLGKVYVLTSTVFFDSNLYEVFNGEHNFITDIKNDIPTNSQIYSHSDFVYVQQNENVKVIDNNEISEISLTTNLLSRGFFEFQDNLYYDGLDGLYKVVENQFNLIVEYEGQVLLRIESFPNDIVIVESTDDEFGMLSNDEIIPLENLELFNFDYLGEEHLELFEPIATNTFKSSIYDLNTFVEYKLPDSIALQNLIRLAEIDQGFMLITTEGFSGQSEVNVYTANNTFTEFTLRSNFMSSNTWSEADFLNFENEGFLYADDELLLMDNQYSFHEMDEDIVGDPSAIKILEKDGFFYFIAISPEYGRQLYRSLVYSKRIDFVANNDFIETTLFPNPAIDFIILESEDYQIKNATFILSDVNGRIIDKRKLTDLYNTMSISELSNGLYFYSVVGEDNRAINAGKFIKLSK